MPELEPVVERVGWPGQMENWMRGRLTDSQRFMLLCVIVGVFCGLVGVIFQLSIDFLFQATIVESLERDSPWDLAGLLLLPAAGGLVTGLVLTYVAPAAAGSGIPQTKEAYHHKFGQIPWRDGMWRLLLGTISVGTGNSLGREGPTVHICAALASTIGRVFGLARARVQAMVPVGMGAGIAAAFNTPIAALFFVFEELLSDFSSKALGGMVVGVVIAAIVERSLLGDMAALTVHFDPPAQAPWMLVCLPMGLTAALLGHLFVSMLLGFREYFRQWTGAPRWVKTTIGGLGVGVLGFSVFGLCGHLGVYSTGHGDLNASLAGHLGLTTLVLLLAGKMLATTFCYGAGGSGGIFAPVLFIGSMLGGIHGRLLLLLFPDLDPEVVQACALLGTGAFFAAVIRC